MRGVETFHANLHICLELSLVTIQFSHSKSCERSYLYEGRGLKWGHVSMFMKLLSSFEISGKIISGLGVRTQSFPHNESLLVSMALNYTRQFQQRKIWITTSIFVHEQQLPRAIDPSVRVWKFNTIVDQNKHLHLRYWGNQVSRGTEKIALHHVEYQSCPRTSIFQKIVRV